MMPGTAGNPLPGQTPPVQALSPAQQVSAQLGPDYINVRPMGEGGMGALFCAYRRGLGVDVVIKRVKQKYLGLVDQRAEADILKRLKHRYLPRIYDVVQGSDGCLYTVMDLIPGQNLSQFVRQNGPVGQKAAHRWACQLCEVVAYLHEQKPPIIHCDIKPSNLMVTPGGDICLIDFNTSLIFADGILAKGATPGFAAPEQYTHPQAQPAPPPPPVPGGQGTGLPPTVQLNTEVVSGGIVTPAQPGSRTGSQALRAGSLRSSSAAVSVRAGGYGSISKCTDVYGIGATLYYLVTGHPPERALDPLTPLSSYQPRISATFAGIIQRAMQKDQAQRFPDAASMLRALQDVDRLDDRYRRCHLARTVTRWVFALLFCASTACAALGVVQLYQGRQNTYLTLLSQSQTLAEQGDYATAAGLLEQAIEMSPDRADAYLQLAVQLYRQAQYRQALDLLDNAVGAGTLDPGQMPADQAGDFYYIRANCLYELEEYPDAVQAYKQALDCRQDNDAYFRGLALAQARSGDLTAAQQTLETLRQRGAASVDCETVSAEIHAAQGQYDQALAEYRAVLEQTDDPQTLSRVYLSAAQICRQQGDLDGGIQLLRQAVDRLGSAGSLHAEMLAQLLSEKAQADPAGSDACYREAESCLQTVLDQGQGNILTALNLAVIQQNLGEFEQAEQTLLPLCQQYPTDYRPYMRLAFLYADWQAQLPVEARDYSRVQQYAAQADQYYQQAVANGASDLEMTRLDGLLEQLRASGWLS